MMDRKKILTITEVLAALMGLMSAVGSTCASFTPEKINPVESPGLYAALTTYQGVFITTTILSYIAAVASFVAIMALIKEKSWFYNIGLGTGILGFVSGLIPYLLVTIHGGNTPSYMRTIIYGIVIVLLIHPENKEFFKDFKQSGEDIIKESKTETIASLIFYPGVLLWIQTYIVAPSHMLGSVNVYMYATLQIGMGLLLIAIGILLFITSKIQVTRFEK